MTHTNGGLVFLISKITWYAQVHECLMLINTRVSYAQQIQGSRLPNKYDGLVCLTSARVSYVPQLQGLVCPESMPHRNEDLVCPAGTLMLTQKMLKKG